MADAFKIPWVDPRDVKYVKKNLLRVVIYAWRRFHYDVFVEFVLVGGPDVGPPKAECEGSTPSEHTTL